MHNNLNAQSEYGNLGALTTPTIHYNGLSLVDKMKPYQVANNLSNNLVWDSLMSDEKKEEMVRVKKIADLETVIKFWKELKHNGASEDLLTSYESIISRYTAEIFYLDDKPLR